MNTLYDEIIENHEQTWKQITEINNESSKAEHKVSAKTYRFRVILIICLSLLSIVSGILIGCTLYKHEAIGLHTVCYTTKTGKCYHASSCSFLRSRHKTNVYSARKHGYRKCSFCSVGPLDHSNKAEVGYGLLTTFGISLIPFIFAVRKRNSKEKLELGTIRKNREEKVERTKAAFDSFLDEVVKKNGILKIVGAPEHIQLMNGELYSSKENIYRFICPYGNCHHINKKCLKGYYNRVLVYDLPPRLYPCSKCGSYGLSSVPEWYNRFKTIRQMIR